MHGSNRSCVEPECEMALEGVPECCAGARARRERRPTSGNKKTASRRPKKTSGTQTFLGLRPAPRWGACLRPRWATALDPWEGSTWLARGAAHPGHHGRCRGPGCGYHGDAPGGPDPPRSRATVPLTWVGPVLLGTMRIHRKQDTHRYKIQDLEHVHRIFMVRSPNFPT